MVLLRALGWTLFGMGFLAGVAVIFVGSIQTNSTIYNRIGFAGAGVAVVGLILQAIGHRKAKRNEHND